MFPAESTARFHGTAGPRPVRFVVQINEPAAEYLRIAAAPSVRLEITTLPDKSMVIAVGCPRVSGSGLAHTNAPVASKCRSPVSPVPPRTYVPAVESTAAARIQSVQPVVLPTSATQANSPVEAKRTT